MKVTMVWLAAMWQVGLGIVIAVSASVAILQSHIDPTVGPVSAFVASLPAIPLMGVCMAASLALRFFAQRAHAEGR